MSWSQLAGEVGGEDKLSYASDYGAKFRFDTVAGARPGDRIEPISI